jgi:nucleotide-binding universal stress UspA family protein
MNLFQRIIIATDFSDASTPAWEEALSLALENEASLVVVHAYERRFAIPSAGVTLNVYEEWDRYALTAADDTLDQLVAAAKSKGIAAEKRVLAGDAEDVIVDAARDADADLIVMGTHGRRGISRVFLGSVAARVVASAPCPVLTVRERRMARPKALSAQASRPKRLPGGVPDRIG